MKKIITLASFIVIGVLSGIGWWALISKAFAAVIGCTACVLMAKIILMIMWAIGLVMLVQAYREYKKIF